MSQNGQNPNISAERLRQSLLDGFFQHLDQQVNLSSQAQTRFLQNRRGGLNQMANLIALQIPGGASVVQPPVMDSQQLDAFGRGKLTDCLGPAYAIYGERRTPRIPNGDLKFLSRVTEIDGDPLNFKRPASVTTEYDVPLAAWFVAENAYPETPYSVLMEMALQPCGILSAWMGTMLQEPDIDFYFRNLDGWAELTGGFDLRGKTVTVRANLLSTLSTGDTIIQKFSFDLSFENTLLYQGESSFGYFSPQAMSKQLGLDGGRQTRPALEAAQVNQDIRVYMETNSEQPYLRLPGGKLQFLDKAAVILDGGRYGSGYVYASKEINPVDWFYDCHFYQDPVMPGSLGVEAMLQAIQIYAMDAKLGHGLHSPRFGQPANNRMIWKYRGQITPAHQRMELEAHISGIERQGNEILLQADASLWVDNIRIYDVKQAAVSLLEG
jgi:3-hydroxymyristoyl/3-hydroxydecanoyl-(acyl carrier protein) dehydratase